MKLKEVRKLMRQLEGMMEGEDFMLYSYSGTILLVDRKNGLISGAYPNIPSDGGDPDILRIGGKQYIAHLHNESTR